MALNPDIIIAPVVTEKSAGNVERGIYTFKVVKTATKTQINNTIETAFGVNVVKINTLNTKPKDKRVGKYTGKTKTYKKAIVTLAEGQSIDL